MKIARYISRILFYVILLLVSACNIHQWPDPEEVVPLRVAVKYNLNDLEWTQLDVTEGISQNDKSKTVQKYIVEHNQGKVRYTIRLMSVPTRVESADSPVREYTFVKEVSESRDIYIELDAPPGEYRVMVWADYMKEDSEESYYDASNFAQITFNGEHEGNNDLHDAFSGGGVVMLTANGVDDEPVEVDIQMHRPFAKFELVTTDLKKFIESEIARKGNLPEDEKKVDLKDYDVVVYYVGYFPDVYSLYTDKPVDASNGVYFESFMDMLDEERARLGFDYVFIGDNESAVTVQVAVFDKNEALVSLTEPMEVVLNRGQHSVLQGSFLLTKAAGGVDLDTDYEGEYNIVVK